MSKTVQFSSTNIVYSPLHWDSSSPGGSPSSPELAQSSLPTELIPDEQPLAIPQNYYDQVAPYSGLIIYSPWPVSRQLLAAPPRPKLYSDPPPTPQTPTQLHVLLSFMPFTPPHVHYDVSHPLHTLNPQLTASFLDPATFPALPELTIHCRHIPWPIPVAASASFTPLSTSLGAKFVSVLDVFTALYTSLRLAVRQTEYDALSAGGRLHVNDAYFARCARVSEPEERHIETLKGVKRVDFLLGRTRFMGLSGPVGGAAHIWELNLT